MVELSSERVNTILEEETQKTVKLKTLLRAVYNRYMHLYEKYFADIDALNDDVIAELNQYHEETRSLIKYYYMDIPQDICMELNDFDTKSVGKLLGSGWHEYLFDMYKYFRDVNWNKSEEWVRAEFRKQAMDGFYDAMGSVFRKGFGTASETAGNIASELTGLLFVKKEEE